jgi:hypothetical protein
MSALSLLIRPTDNGWGVYLSDGQELMRYRGLCAKRHALRYLQRYTESVGRVRRPQTWPWKRHQAGRR